jgi:hypothetical protein
MKSVYSAVRTGSLNKADCASSLSGEPLLRFVFKWLTTSALKEEAQSVLFKDLVCTTQLTLFISVIKTNQFML